MRKGFKFVTLFTLSFLLLPMITVSLLLHFIESNIFEPKSLEKHFTESGLYPVLTSTLHERLQERAESETDSAEMKLFMRSIREAVEKTVTDDWLKERVFHLQTSLLNYASGRASALDSIPIADLRDSMLDSIKRNFSGPEAKELPKEEIDKAMQQLEKMIPASADLAEIYKVEDGQLGKLIDFYNKKEQIRTLVWSLVFMLAGLGIVISYYLTYIGRWLGFTLSGVGLAIYIGYTQLDLLDLTSLIGDRSSGAFGQIQETLIRIAERLIDAFAHNIMNDSVILFVVGAILVAISYLPWMKALTNWQRSKLSGAKYFWIRFLASLLLVAAIGWRCAEAIQILTA